MAGNKLIPKPKKIPVAPSPNDSSAHSSAAYVPTPADRDRERRYRAEDALRDIERAEKHKIDKTLMSDVKKVAAEKMRALSAITGKK